MSTLKWVTILLVSINFNNFLIGEFLNSREGNLKDMLVVDYTVKNRE